MQLQGTRRGVGEGSGLYRDGSRKYLNADERSRIARAAMKAPVEDALLVMTLSFTGARLSEATALCRASFQVDLGIVAIDTLKRRRSVTREVPIPPNLMDALDKHFAIRAAQISGVSVAERLWPWCRTTAWKKVKQVIAAAGITGLPACPRGLRHGFGIRTLQAGVPLNLVQRWMGHASMSSTARYTAASGPEEIEFAERFWRREPMAMPASLSRA